MGTGSKVFVRCKLSRSAFASERVFAIKTATGSTYNGIAPVIYCFKANGAPLRAAEPKGPQSVGKVAARIVSNGGNKAVVAVPSGETIEVPTDIVSQRE
jgi:hypothetical protein